MSEAFLEQSLGFLVNRLARAFASSFHAANGPLTSAQFVVLQDIHDHPGTSQREISARTRVDAATLTEMVKRLEKTGTLSRSRSDSDTRKRELSLTSAGLADVTAARRVAVEVNAYAASGLSKEEFAQLKTLLGTVEANLRWAG